MAKATTAAAAAHVPLLALYDLTAALVGPLEVTAADGGKFGVGVGVDAVYCPNVADASPLTLWVLEQKCLVWAAAAAAAVAADANKTAALVELFA